MIHILDHLIRARKRVIEQFKELPIFDALLEALMIPVQELEDVFFNMTDQRSIFTGVGYQLDLWGQMLDKPRNGLTDDDEYRVVLLAKVAQNISQGTAADVMRVYQLLMRAQYVQYSEEDTVHAAFSLTAINSNPIGDIENIKKAVRSSKMGGVKINLLSSVPGAPFSFADDPDPNGRGFGDLDDPSVGGVMSEII